MNATKILLIEAGVELFKKYGYHQVTIDDIANECGLSKGAFYHHFKTKGELLGLYNLYTYEQLPPLVNSLLTVTNPYEQLWIAFEAIYGNTTDNLGAELIKQLIVNDIQQSKEDPVLIPKQGDYLGRYQKPFETLIKIVENGQRDGSVKAGFEPTDLINAFIGTVFASGTNWYAHSGQYDRRKELHVFYEIIFKP